MGYHPVTKQNKSNLIWLDMEMTGLDPKKERIIEIATIVTDIELNILAEGPNLVIHQPPRLLRAMDAWNQKQHKKSGLIEAVNHSKVTLKEAQKLTLDFVKEYCKPNKSPLCGNSIHHDRKFLVKYMPELNYFFHYRHLDVSSLKILIQNWYGKKAAVKKKDAHRALDDIHASIEELKFYREHYFKTSQIVKCIN